MDGHRNFIITFIYRNSVTIHVSVDQTLPSAGKAFFVSINFMYFKVRNILNPLILSIIIKHLFV